MILAGSARRSASSAPAGMPATAAIRVASSSIGSCPGVIRSMGHASDPRAGSSPAAMAGSSPARISEDFPDPDGPRIISRPGRVSWPASRVTTAAVSRSRPKNMPASCAPNAASPGYGHSRATGTPAASSAAARAASGDMPLIPGAPPALAPCPGLVCRRSIASCISVCCWASSMALEPAAISACVSAIAVIWSLTSASSQPNSANCIPRSRRPRTSTVRT